MMFLKSRFVFTTLALALLAACDVPTAPALPFPSSAVRFTPALVSLDATYRAWWAEVEDCAGRTGDLSGITWYTVPSSGSAIVIDGRDYSGAWYSAGNRIVLAENSIRWGAGVRHEMLHALLHEGAHPPDYFLGKCADVVACLGTSCS